MLALISYVLALALVGLVGAQNTSTTPFNPGTIDLATRRKLLGLLLADSTDELNLQCPGVALKSIPAPRSAVEVTSKTPAMK
jgi:hypothetical protein